MRREIITAPGPGTMSTIQFAKSTPISVSRCVYEIMLIN